MKPLVQKGNETTPYVNFNNSKGKFEMGGIAIPENVYDVFNPIKEWLNTYSTIQNESPEFEFYFEYLNTSATKMVFDIFSIIDQMTTGASTAKIKWYYNRGDVEMLELGEEMLDEIDCASEIIALDTTVV